MKKTSRTAGFRTALVVFVATLGTSCQTTTRRSVTEADRSQPDAVSGESPYRAAGAEAIVAVDRSRAGSGFTATPRTSGDEGWWATKWDQVIGYGFRGQPQGSPAGAIMLRYSQFAVMYDVERQIPLWAAYSVDRRAGDVADSGMRSERRNPTFARPGNFFVEPLVRLAAEADGIPYAVHSTYGDAIDPRFPVPRDWAPEKARGDKRIIQRGHVVPNNAMKCLGDEETGVKAQRESFSLANVVPQMNEHNAPTWSALESAILAWAQEYDRVWVIGGPIVTTDPPARIKGRVDLKDRGPVAPDAMFYVVAVIEDGALRMCGFVIPHRPENLAYAAEEHMRSVDEVEAITGLNFMPELGEPAAEEQDLGTWLINRGVSK